jgi:hypothetical protein
MIGFFTPILLDLSGAESDNWDEDSSETKNLIQNHPEMVRRLKGSLNKLRSEVTRVQRVVGSRSWLLEQYQACRYVGRAMQQL